MKLSVRVCLVTLGVYAAAAAFGEVQYRLARSRDVVPAYNAVDLSSRYQPPSLRLLREMVMNRGSLACCSPWGCKEMDTT